jgi:uncharacterized protein
MSDTKHGDVVTSAPSLGPTGQTQRIVSLDVLRGFALLGILVVNIQSFAMVDAAYMNPTAFGDLTGANYWVWLLTHVFFDQKFMSIFSMLFGAGMVLMADRAQAAGRPPDWLHCRRMASLLVIGLLHAHLLWFGDILVLYAVCGLVVYWFRRLNPIWLCVLGLGLISIGSGISLMSGWSMPYWGEEPLAQFEQGWQPPAEVIEAEIATYRGSWLRQMEHRVPAALYFETLILVAWGFWRAGGMMFIGMAFFKWGVFNATRSRQFYLWLIAAAVLVGVPLVLYGVRRNFAEGWDVSYSFFWGGQYNGWGSILVCLGYVGLVMLFCQSQVLDPLRRSLAAVGQTALTNYLLQTILCTTLFYGHGFGLFGSVSRTGQVCVVIAVWAFQLIISPLWLKRFRFGPFEWVWRCMTYLRIQPLRQTRITSN